MTRIDNSKWWVFWLRISYRPKWFSYWWSTRGSNFKEWQIGPFLISIGLPWVERTGGDTWEEANKDNLKGRLSIKIGR